MTIKPTYRRTIDKETEKYRLSVAVTLSASDMEDLLSAAAIGWNLIADKTCTEGFPDHEPYWRQRAAEANEKAMLIGQRIETIAMDQRALTARQDTPLCLIGDSHD